MANDLIAEIVTFRAAEGVSDARLRELAGALAPWLDRTPGFLARTLSRTEDGIWTDHVLWQSRAAADAAAARIMSEPLAAPFMQAIDPASVDMRHAAVHVRQNA